MADSELGPNPTTQAALRLLPKIGPIAATWRQEMHDREQRRLEQLGAAAAEDIGAEALFELIAGSERLSDMFRTAVDAAMSTGSEAKIRLLGRALASGATAEDQAKIDEAEQLLRIAAELDPVDLRALRALERRSTSDARHTVGFALDISEATAGPIVARLERLSLIEVERQASVQDKKDPDDDSVNLDETWSSTPTSKALLSLLREPSLVGSDRPAAGSTWDEFTRAQAELLDAIDDLRLFCLAFTAQQSALSRARAARGPRRPIRTGEASDALNRLRGERVGCGGQVGWAALARFSKLRAGNDGGTSAWVTYQGRPSALTKVRMMRTPAVRGNASIEAPLPGPHENRHSQRSLPMGRGALAHDTGRRWVARAHRSSSQPSTRRGRHGGAEYASSANVSRYVCEDTS